MLEDDREKGEPRLDAEAGTAPAADQGYKVGYGRPPVQGQFKPAPQATRKAAPRAATTPRPLSGKS
jgi:hypothetical protein